VALVALAGAAALVVSGGLASLGGVVLLVAGLFVVVGGAWHALTSRRGRVVGELAVVIGLALLVAGFVVADWHTGRIVLALVLAGLSAAAARVALGRDHRTVRARAASRTPRPAARRGVLLINPKSGGGKAEQFRLAEECRRRSIEPVVLQPGDDLRQLAEDAVARGADVLGMAGGDGSQALVADVAMEHDLPLVVVPAGTRNHFALDLGLDRRDVVGALDAYGDGVEVRIDVAALNGRVFVNNATLGVYARIVQSPDYRDAKRQTALAMLPDLLGPGAARDRFSYQGSDGRTHSDADMLLVSNNPYELLRFEGWGTRARLDTGALGVVAATIRNANEAAEFVALELSGRADRFRGLERWSAASLEVASTGPVDVGVDGEALVMEPPLVFESRPGALRVRVPRLRAGRSPAGRAVHLVSGSTLGALVGVVVGRSSATF
jgi:diacylglycerol kinase family enzyme